MMQGERVVQIPDSTVTEGYRAGKAIRELIDRSGVRKTLGIALRNDSALLGAIFVNRREVRPFSDKEIDLLENFAAQAVIAMENARLLTETREALERQTATAEILRVISGSPTDVQPTFDAIAAAARSLTDAALGGVVTYDGRLIHLACLSGFTPAESEQIRGLFPLPADHGSANGRDPDAAGGAHPGHGRRSWTRLSDPCRVERADGARGADAAGRRRGRRNQCSATPH
jgi:hypothetical protein